VLAFGLIPELDTTALTGSPLLKTAAHAGGMAGEALIGWFLFAIPAALLMTVGLNLALKRVPALKNDR
jgi:hypothetical protein